jgi:hypothetical protein
VATKRRTKEAQLRALPKLEASTEDTRQELQSLLDQELSRLPNKYREAVVLCHLQGKTRGQAAGQLGIPVGTLSGRLTTARRILARRLTRRGLALSSGLLAGLCPDVASACVPVSLVLSTIRGALLLSAGQVGAISAKVAILTQGVVKAMLMSQAKTLTAVVLAVGVAAIGGSMLTQQIVRDWGTEPEHREQRLEQTRQELAKNRGHAAPRWYIDSQGQTMVILPGPVEFQELAKNRGQAAPQWYINSQGQTMVVIPGPVEFRMGSPLAEAINVRGEASHHRRIKPLFAIAATPVTRQQFICFRPRFFHNEMGRNPSQTCPTGGVTWYEAAAYCNRLSKQ